MYINNLGHMTKMAAMPIYGKNPSKIISETNRLISRKLGVRHRWLKYSNVYINHDPVMTLTKFMARSTWVACASELGKLLKCHLKEKANRKLANGQNIEDSEKRKWPKGLSAPALELNTIIFKHVYWYMQLISGERLQDHWSSGNRFGNNNGFVSKLTLMGHVSSVFHCGSVMLCARHQACVTDIVALTAVICRLDTAFM